MKEANVQQNNSEVENLLGFKNLEGLPEDYYCPISFLMMTDTLLIDGKLHDNRPFKVKSTGGLQNIGNIARNELLKTHGNHPFNPEKKFTKDDTQPDEKLLDHINLVIKLLLKTEKQAEKIQEFLTLLIQQKRTLQEVQKQITKLNNQQKLQEKEKQLQPRRPPTTILPHAPQPAIKKSLHVASLHMWKQLKPMRLLVPVQSKPVAPLQPNSEKPDLEKIDSLPPEIIKKFKM